MNYQSQLLEKINYNINCDKETLLQTIKDLLHSQEAINESDFHPLENISNELKIRIVEESKKDPLFLISLIRVAAPEGYVPLDPYEKQKYIVKSCLEDHYVTILGSRQTGKTTIIFAYSVWLSIFFDHYKIGIIVQKDDSLKKAVSEFYMLYQSLPSWLRYKTTKDDAREKHFSNGSKFQGYLVDPKNPDSSGRGVKVDFLIVDEAAFIPKISKAYTALKPATSRRHLRLKNNNLPYGTVIISTPNGTFGIGEWFYKFWTNSLNGTNGFKAIKFHWTEVPEYDEEWFKEATKELSERDIAQEYELVFFGSQNAYFPDSIIERLQKNIIPVQEYKSLKLSAGTVYLKDTFSNDTIYLIGADPADTGADASAAIIYDFFNQTVIGYYYEYHVGALDFLKDILELGVLVKNSIIIHERNAFSTNVQILYNTLGSHRVYMAPDKRKKNDYKYAGITTTGASRKLMLSSLYSFVEQHAENINLEPLVHELVALERKGSRVEAAEGQHDDLVFALSFCLYVQDYGSIEDYLRYFPIDREEFKQVRENLEIISSLNQDATFVASSVDIENPVLQLLIEDRNARIEATKIADQIFLDDEDTPKETKTILSNLF